MARWECHDLGKTTEFLGMHISHDHKNWKIFIDQYKYLEKVLAYFNVATNPTHTPLPSEFSFKPNEKQCDPKFCQKYQQLCKGTTLGLGLVTWVGSYLRAVVSPIAFPLSAFLLFCVIPCEPLNLILDFVGIYVRYHENGA